MNATFAKPFPATSAGAPVIRALWPQGFREASRFNAVLERALKERKGVVLRNDTDVELATDEDLRFLLAYPVTGGDELHGVAVVEIFPREQIELQAAMRKLQWGISWLQNCAAGLRIDLTAPADRSLPGPKAVRGSAVCRTRAIPGHQRTVY